MPTFADSVAALSCAARQSLVIATVCLPVVSWAQMTYVSQTRTVSANTHFYYDVLKDVGSDGYGGRLYSWTRVGSSDSESITSDATDFGSFEQTVTADHFGNTVGVSTTQQSTLLTDSIRTAFSISLNRSPYQFQSGMQRVDLNDKGRSLVQTTFDLTAAASFEAVLSSPLSAYAFPYGFASFKLVNDQTGDVTSFALNTPQQFTLSPGRYSLTADIAIGNQGSFIRQGTLAGTFNLIAVPEPSTWGMMLLGLLGICQLARRGRNT